jgi:hypothetical protein
MQWAAQKLQGSYEWFKDVLEGFVTFHLMASVCSHCYCLCCLKEENKNEKSREERQDSKGIRVHSSFEMLCSVGW